MAGKKTATVAFEDPKSLHGEARYFGQVRQALSAMGAPIKFLLPEEFVQSAYRGKIDPKSAAAVIWHKHCEDAASKKEVPCVAETEAACPHDPPTAVVAVVSAAERKRNLLAEASRLIAEASKEESEAQDGGLACQPFTRLERDPERFAACKAKAKGPLDTDRKMFLFLRDEMNRQDQEVVAVVGLDLHRHLRSYTEVVRGQRNRVTVDVKDILRVAFNDGSHGFVVAHNHPSGLANPSKKDKELTAAIREKSATMDLLFLDHLIIGSDNWFSFHDGLHKWI